MSRRLNILVLSAEPPYPPTHGGARIRLYHLLRLLSPVHNFSLLTLLEAPEEREYLPPLQEVCCKVHGIYRKPPSPMPTIRDRLVARWERLTRKDEFAEALGRELSANEFDLVHVDYSQMAYYAPLLDGIPKVIAATDSLTLARRSHLKMASGWEETLLARYNLYRKEGYERKFFGQYDACVVIAERDREVVRELCPHLAVEVAPNGTDLDYFKPALPESAGEQQLLFTGTMDYGPNVDAVLWFVREMLPRIQAVRPNVRLEIVGRAPVEEVKALAAHPNVSVTGFVSDLRPHLASATVYVCPLRLGSGMKNKVLEAMASGKPIVTTSEGASGISAVPNEHFVVADDPQAFAQEVVRLLESADSRRRLGDAARRFVEQNYSWERMADAFNAVYQSVVRP